MSVQSNSITPSEVSAVLAVSSKAAESERLAERLRQVAGPESLQNGTWAVTDELDVVWAIEAPDAAEPPRIVSNVGHALDLELTRLGTTDVYAATAALPEGAALRWHYQVDDAKVGGGQIEVYRTHPDGRRKPGVPVGEVIQQPRWRSRVFAGTVRDWWIYVPAQYDPSRPACTMIFQDGGTHYKDHVPPVFDNLIKPETGGSRIWRWPARSSLSVMTSRLFGARDSTRPCTAERSCPTRCAGCGGRDNLQPPPNRFSRNPSSSAPVSSPPMPSWWPVAAWPALNSPSSAA